MRRRRLVVFAAASVAAVTLLIWALLPYLFPPVYHAVDITIEYRNFILLGIFTDTANVRTLVSTRITLEQQEKCLIWLDTGSCRVSVGGRSYDSILVMVTTSLKPKDITKVGPSTKAGVYVLGLFGNNSELGDFFRSYGFPYTYVQAAYSYVSEGSVNRTLLSITHPNGSHLFQISVVTPSATHAYTPKDYYYAQYHLRNSHNLTILHYKETTQEPCISSHWKGIGHVNLTVGAGSLIWKALGRIEYLMNITTYGAYPLYQMAGKIGWIEWG